MAEKKNAAPDMEAVFIPKESKHDDAIYIAVNGERMLVKKGETVFLPRRFAEVVKNSQAMSREAERYIEENMMAD